MAISISWSSYMTKGFTIMLKTVLCIMCQYCSSSHNIQYCWNGLKYKKLNIQSETFFCKNAFLQNKQIFKEGIIFSRGNL